MKYVATLGFLLLFSGLSTAIWAQSTSCEYTLEMFDSFGDGWNGANLTVNVGSQTTNYTVNATDNDGFSRTVTLIVTGGQTITLTYAPGVFENEVTYTLRDSDGNIVFSDGPNPDIGLVFTGVISCPSCPAVPASSVAALDVRAFTAKVGWVPSDTLGVYVIEYDTTGFAPGTGSTIQAIGNQATLAGLQQNTEYQYYLTVLCANGDTSNRVGPFSFKTLWANDVGASALVAPKTGCGLSANEEIRVRIRNFGGNPQSLIPIRFSVNGQIAPVNIPIDGFYTGVLGKDSSDVFLFDLRWDFSEPGEYIVQIWTDLPADSLRTNDTLTVTVLSIPVINELPYLEDFETWNGGWKVGATSVNSTWQFGEPSAPLLNAAASGANAWVTNLSGLYNNSEFSFLESPCIDFSNLTEDPRLLFSLWFDGEACCDEAWVESSFDGGETWSKVGTSGTGLNWYNDAANQWWDGTGGFTGWVSAFNTLTGAAGQEDVRIRFVFSSDGSVNREGMGIDNIFIAEPVERDIFNQTAAYTAAAACGTETGTLRTTLVNLGTTPQTGFNVSYSINGGAPVVENVGMLNILPNQQATYTFTTPLVFTQNGTYNIRIWSSLTDDLVPDNDTTSLSIQVDLVPIISSLPYGNDFESGAGGWKVGPGSVAPSWQFGQPAAPMLNAAASGQNAWVTNLTGNYNNSELSYLVSPCFDFSSITTDPRLSFSLWYDGEACCDEAWVERSIDGGQTWAKVGTSGTGINWYNDPASQWWDGTGGFTGWVTAFNTLQGTAGQANVRIRFVFSTDGSVSREGMGVDNIRIAVPAATDVSNASSAYTLTGSCGVETGTLRMTIINLGSTAQSNFDVSYSVNGGPAVTANVGNLNILPNEQGFFTFPNPLSFNQSGNYQIRAWTNLTNDADTANDTLQITITANVAPIVTTFPYFTDYETGEDGWSVATNSANSSWEFGEPEGTLINTAASGLNAWVTNLEGDYNNSELSYLVSPCFNFSTFTADPRLSFSLFFDSENNNDRGWVERSLDGGITWAKVGTANSGQNWYNNGTSQWWTGTGGFNGWVTASNILTGTAGQQNVRIRFVFSSSAAVVREGMAIDDVSIAVPAVLDVSGANVVYTPGSTCGTETGTLRITIANVGSQAQTGFSVGYSINGDAPVVENVGTLNVAPNQQGNYTFTTPLTFTQNGDYTITAWTSLAGDVAAQNDTFVTVIQVDLAPVITAFPYSNDFENGAGGWKVGSNSTNSTWQFGEPNGTLIDEAASGINAWVTNLSGTYNNSELSYLVSPCFDLSGFSNDPFLVFSLIFDSEACCDEAWVERSFDGGQTWAKVLASPSSQNWYNDGANNWWDGTGGFPAGWVTAFSTLTGAAGQSNVRIRFVFSTDGSVVREGIGVDDVTISNTPSATEAIERIERVALTPNPTSGLSTLAVQFTEPVDAHIMVLDMLGRPLSTHEITRTQSADIALDLSDNPAGIYLVRIMVEGKVKTLKLVRAN